MLSDSKIRANFAHRDLNSERFLKYANVQLNDVFIIETRADIKVMSTIVQKEESDWRNKDQLADSVGFGCDDGTMTERLNGSSKDLVISHKADLYTFINRQLPDRLAMKTRYISDQVVSKGN